MRSRFFGLLSVGWLWASLAWAQTPTIDRIEYFIDTDPGSGSAVSVSFTPGQTVNDVSFNVPVNTVSAGFHELFVRARDNNGRWSLTSSQPFFKDNATIPAANIDRIEYFIDADPGYGSATSVSFTAGQTVDDVAFTVPLTNVSLGFHTLFVRARSAEGRWSVVSEQPFFKDDVGQTNITRIEYFIDTDPGVGQATSVSFTSAVTVSNLDYLVDLTGVPSGVHRLFVRAQNASGRWSLIATRDFTIQANVITLSGATEWCRAGIYTLNFTTTGTYQPGNLFTAQLSDPNGNFGTITPLASVSGTSSGVITFSIPNGVAVGAGYRVRVVSSNPAVLNMPSLGVTLSETCVCTHAAQINAPSGTNFCTGGSVVIGAEGINANGPFTFRWRRAGVQISTAASLTVSQAGTYIVDVADSRGCTVSSSVEITQAANLPVSITGSTSFCAGQSVLLTGNATGGSAPYSYQWRVGGVNTGTNTSTFAVSSAGSYGLVVTDGRGCTGTANAVSVTQRPSPTATITPSGSTQLAPGTSVGLSTPIAAGQTYQWLRDGQPIAGATASSFSATQAGSYAVVVSAGGCSATSAVSVISIILANEPVAVGFSLAVSPNPTSSLLRAVLTLDAPAPATLRLFDAAGRQVRMHVASQAQRTHEHRFEIGNVPSGVLYLRAEVAGKQLTQKIVKE